MHLQTAISTWLTILTVSHVATSQTDFWSGEQVSYKGAQVWRVSLKNVKHVVLLKSFEQNKEISLWRVRPAHADFLVPEEYKVQVNRRLQKQDMNHSVLLMDVQRRIDAIAMPQAEWNGESLRLGHRLDFTFYPEMQVIDEYFSIIKEQYQSICTVQTIGRTSQDRNIKMAVISNGNPANKAIMLTGGMHGREWISIASVLYILNAILTNFDNQPMHVKNIDWYIVPVVNPDGYVHTHTTDRLWRKNRSVREWSTCVGVDINRNFGMNWYVSGVTETRPCSEGYGGHSAFSESESIAIKNVTRTRKMAAFVDMHSYGQTILYPYSSLATPAKHQQILKKLADDMSAVMYSANQKTYISGSVYNMLYPCSGTALDYMYASGVTNSFVIETRDEGYNAFLLPPNQIVETSIELLMGLFDLVESIQPTFRGRECHSWF